MKNGINVRNKLSIGSVIAVVVSVFALIRVARVYAVWTPSTATADFDVSSQLGQLSTLDTVLLFVANLLKYVGWAGVIIAILAVIGLLIFKLIGEDNENTMKTVQGGITKAVIIALLGLLLLSAGFFINFVSSVVGDSRTSYSLNDAASTAP